MRRTPAFLWPRTAEDELSAFGAFADSLCQPFVDVGGFLVPGLKASFFTSPGENVQHATAREGFTGESPSAQARSAARPWERSAEAPAGAAPHSIVGRLTDAGYNLGELETYYPVLSIVPSSLRFARVTVGVGLFRTLSFRSRLHLELPLLARVDRSPANCEPSPVPDVRAWATWEGGPLSGQRVRSHHEYPDGAICACRLHEWLMGEHPLLDYVSYCTLWIAKSLHEQYFGYYPGLQHLPPWIRRLRGREGEYCGCGAARRYRDCCMQSDQSRSLYSLARESMIARSRYRMELLQQGRTPCVSAL